MSKEVKSVWLGPEFISFGFSNEDEKMIYHKDLGPASRKRPILIEPLDIDDLWEERKELVKSGIRKDPVRVYWMDIQGNRYHRMLNIKQLNRLKSLELENEQLRSYVEELREMIDAESNLDRLKKKVKEEHDFYVEKLKPAFRPTGFGLEGQQ